MPNPAEIRKALIVLVVVPITAVAARIGLNVDDPAVLTAITTLLTAVSVYLIPNEQRG